MLRLPFFALLFVACHPDVQKDTGTTPLDSGCADEGIWYSDDDGDGYGDLSASVSGCTAPVGAVADATDCDDSAASVHPGAPEIWYDGSDEDCSGGSDYDQDGDGYDRDAECDDLDPTRYPDPSVEEIWYNGTDENCDGNDGDQDGDGWYAAGYPYEVPSTYAAFTGDCWDDPAAPPPSASLNGFRALQAADVHPGATDVAYDGLDADCAGDDDFDADVDGFRTDAWPDEIGQFGDDCLDEDATVHPGATDTWYDGVDTDCAGNDDFDADGDGYDQAGGSEPLDCDDTDADYNPARPETCATPQDDNCDGTVNESGAVGCVTWYADSDGDGYGAAETQCLCAASGTYTATVGADCDDATSDIHPGAAEVCDGIDEDCDGAFDNGVGTLYNDADHDGFGDAVGGTSCTGTVSDHSDCDDSEAATHPGATEVCDGNDQNCDGTADEGLPVNYPDTDGDHYGSTTGAASCTPGAANNTDCNDTNAAVNPGVPEVCNGIDDNCSGAADDGLGTWYVDADHDGYGSPSATTTCALGVSNNGDCNDANAAISPLASEACNALDDNCNGSVDEGLSPHFSDLDGDGHGAGTASCTGTGVASSDDCDDTDRYVYPGALELCDGQRNDCATAGWTASDEAGIASQRAVDGTWSDITPALAVGTGASAATWVLGNGSSLSICPGTWYVHFLAGTGVASAEIVGLYGPGTTVLDGAASASVISTSGTSSMNLRIVGVTIQNGSHSTGGGIYFAGGGLTLEDDVISLNDATLEGGGLYAMNANVSITATSIDNNTAGGSGGGIDAVSSSVTLDGVSLTANSVDTASGATGGGMSYTASGAEDLSITGCTFEANTASLATGTAYAGALYVYRGGPGTITVSSTYFVDNVASVIGGSNPLAVGGGIYAYLAGTGATEFTDTTFSGNNAIGSYQAEGGAVYLWNDGSGAVTVTGAEVVGNYIFTNSGYGAGLIFYGTGGGPYTIAASTIHDNLSYNTSYLVNGTGGGLYTSLSATAMVIDGTTIDGNAATSGGGIYASLDVGSTLTVQNDSAIQSNTGYGAQVQGVDSASQFALNDSRITNNSSAGLYLLAVGRSTAANASCTGASTEAAGIYENGTLGVFGSCTSPAVCTFLARGCDFDNPVTGVSNGTYDVYMFGTYANYGVDATFNCTAGACM